MPREGPRRLQRMERRSLPGGGTAYVARTTGQRLLGLMGLRALAPGCALVFPGCDSVHTAWMRMSIDVVFVDADGRVLELRRSLPPWRVARCRGAAAVLECPAGGAAFLLSGLSSRAATGA